MREAVIVSAARTPVGRVRGVLAPVPAHELGALVIKEAVARAKIDPGEVEDVIFGNLFANETANMARMALLTAGLPVHVPGITVDRQCSSSLNAIALAAALIQSGYADVLVAGGTESDSRRVYIMEKPTNAYQVSPPRFLNVKLAPDDIGDPPMVITAENMAVKYNLTRQECDEFALRSHQRATKAWEAGRFDDQVVPVSVPQGKGAPIIVNKDETFRPDTSMQVLSKLPPAMKKDGIVTAGNSSPMSDGAGAVVIMEKCQAMNRGLEPLATFRGYATVGVDPNIMGIGPVPATRRLFERVRLRLEDVDLYEVNEAFAAQIIPCIRELNLDEEKLNVNGGAIALGHPLGGTGAILTTKLVYEMKRRNLRYGLISFCCGGGQGFSALFERG
ncbi:acetyl-CoA C-acetyltransferase [Anaerolineae bacterium]|nr:acetyl-CoA C-acetyltransferase [Anaerolineae bacterium]